MSLNQEIFLDTLSKFITRANYEAATLFGKLDPHLCVNVSGIAVPLDKSAGGTLIFPDNSRISASWFSSVETMAQGVPLTYLADLAPDVRGVLWQERVKIWKAIRSIIESQCNELESSGFTMYPAFIHGFCVALTLQVSSKVLDSHYSLFGYSNWGYPASSLIYETIAAFLYKSVTPLEKLSSGVPGHILSENGDEILRRAGFWLMDALEKATKSDDEDGQTENLFRICNVISSQFYEGVESRGRLVISRRDHPDTGEVIRLRNPITVRNDRGIRKLLEVCTAGLHLLCDSSGIYGIGKRSSVSDPNPEQKIFVVDFIGHYKWKLSHAGRELMVVSYGQPQLPQKPVDEESFRRRIRTQFVDIESDDLAELWALVCEAPKQKHGTTIVVSDHGEEEARRLAIQSTPIEPIRLSSELILPISSIDGAILIDPRCVCYAMGVILDGLASEAGNPARGARYNSALRYSQYAQTLGHRCLIVVISADGSVDII